MQNPMTVPVEPAIVEELHARLKPEGVEAYIRYIMNRTPADMQDEMLVLLQEDLGGAGGGPEDETQAIVTHGQAVGVLAVNGMVMTTCTAVVAASVLTGVSLPNDTTGFISNGAPVPLKDPALVDQPGSPGSAVVANNQFGHVTYTAPPPGIVLGADQAVVTAFASVPGELNLFPAPWTCQFIVTNQVCDKIKFMPNPAAVALVHGASVPVKDAANVVVAGSPGTANITFSALNGVNLTI